MYYWMQFLNKISELRKFYHDPMEIKRVIDEFKVYQNVKKLMTFSSTE